MEQVVAGNEQAGDSARDGRVERQAELHLQGMVCRDELRAQWPEKVDEERERANAALILDQEIDKRVMDALERNRYTFQEMVLQAVLNRGQFDVSFQTAIAKIVKDGKFRR